MTFIVGLTGGIGSGKSTVADLFALHGVRLVDTDAIAHELTGPQGHAIAAIRQAFGEGVLQADGSLDRTAMRRLVFSDASAKALLEAILHPIIRHESMARCTAAENAPYVLLSVPLLLESGGYREQLDHILVIDCAEALQISRVMARNGLSLAEVQAIMAVQAARSERRAAADDLLTNDGDIENLRVQVDMLHQRYLALAASKLKANS